ncbi:MAG TPA: hydantoinase/oxoprolinase family protein [Stellaceae bacterium]|nr:hydantoinase/oxoprolinase family protein [Stellaceae bacterium]
MGVFVAVDTGGTFTDLVMFDPASGDVRYTKSLTTHENPIEGLLHCVEKARVELTATEVFKHGTTLVINTLLERSGPATALVTTRGFRDLLEFGRGNRTEPFNLFYRRHPPLVPRELRFEVSERVDGRGIIVATPARAEIEALAAELERRGVAAVAVAFLNSYLEPANELAVAEWLRELLPRCYVATGVELTREWYEFERTATSVANAYTGPKIGRYIGALGGALGERRFTGRLLLMGSNGGVLSAEHAASAPILLVESGPVGGCIGAGAYGKALGMGNLIAFDMGGTTAKCAVVRDGDFDIESIYYAGGYGRGTPVRAPVVDIDEVGAGGGSIAWLDGQNRLNVGPKSAGSFPGPVAYGRGGSEPTVTDANLLLGRLDPARFQGGEMQLDPEAARRALEARLAAPLGYAGEDGLLRLAAGILSITAVKMGEAIKRITVQRGRDPRDFALFAYGGGGPLHGLELARELAIPLVIVPPEAGNFSAIGMLLADIRRDDSRTFLRRLEADTIAAMEQEFYAMEAAVRRSLEADFPGVPLAFERMAELRFVGQYHTVRVPVASEDLASFRQSFHRIYRARYGHAIERAPVEIVSLHCAALARTAQPRIERLAGELPRRAPERTKTRPVYFAEAGGTLPTKVFARRDLPIGFADTGPAVIEEYGSTTLLGPGDRFEIGRLGEIRIAVRQHERR